MPLPSLAGQAITLDTLSLYQLPGVWVVVEPFPAVALDDGLHPDSLRTIMENALRSAGIRVFTEDEWQTTLGNPLLSLNVNLIRPSEHFYLYNLELELRQLSTLPRDSMPAFGATWTAGDVLGTIPSARLGTLRFRVARLVDQFISAYVAAQEYHRPWIRRRN